MEAPGDAPHAHRRADGVEVGVLMAHDKDLTGIGDQLAEGVGHHAGLDLCARFDLRAAPAEKFKVELVFHDRLIAAARERHILGERGEGIVLVIARAVESDADAWMPVRLTIE